LHWLARFLAAVEQCLQETHIFGPHFGLADQPPGALAAIVSPEARS
jgi:hypothetical protein